MGAGVALGGGLLQRWQQAFLCQVSLQGVEDVELLIGTESQELLDHFAGVGAPEGRKKIIKHTSSIQNQSKFTKLVIVQSWLTNCNLAYKEWNKQRIYLF